jgi:hypothetical protein
VGSYLTTINAGDGDDTTNIGYNEALPDLLLSYKIDDIEGAVTVNGGAGTDILRVLDRETTNPRTYFRRANSVQRNGNPAITHHTVENVRVYSGHGGNIVNVQANLPDINTVFYTGDGNDIINLDDPDSTTAITFEGDLGYDLLVIPQGVASTPQIDFANLEGIKLNGGTLYLGDDKTIEGLILDGGVLGGTGLLTVTHTTNWTEGGMVGLSTTIIPIGATLAINEPENKTLALRTVEIGGTAVWTGGNINGETGTIHTLNSGSFSGAGALQGQLVNDGLLYPGGEGFGGAISISGNFTQNLTGALKFDLNDNNSDLISVSGTVTLNGILDLIVPGSLSGNTYTILDNTGSAVIETFAGLPEGTPLSVGGKTLWISYLGGDGNDVVLKNDPPTDFILSPSSIAEKQPSGTVVGDFNTTDPNLGDTFSYSLATGGGDIDNGSFAIVGNQLKTAAIFDFENQNNYSIRVRVTDAGGQYFEKVFSIVVDNVNEAPSTKRFFRV